MYLDSVPLSHPSHLTFEGKPQESEILGWAFVALAQWGTVVKAATAFHCM